MARARSISRHVLMAGVVLLLLLAPSQSAVALAGFHVTPADLLLLLLVPFACAAAIANGLSWRRLFTVPFSSALFVILACVSAILSGHLKTGAGECIQFALYFLVADRVFFIARALAAKSGRPVSDRGFRPFIAAFLAIGAVVVLVALWQLFTPLGDEPPSIRTVRGTFGNRNVLGGYYSLLLPFAFGLLFMKGTGPEQAKKLCLLRIGLVLLIVAGFCTILSGAALLAIGLAVFALAVCHGRVAAVVTGVLLVGFLAYVAPNLPHDNLYASIRSVELYDSETGERTRRYPEWQAAVTMSFERPWTGVGPGMYQSKIGTFYDIIPRATGPSEPDIQNMHLVLLSTCGFPAYLAFLAIFLSAIASGVTSRDPAARAAVCSLGAFLVVSIWHPLLVRGIGIPLAFLLAVARYSPMPEDSLISCKCDTIPKTDSKR